MMDLLAFREDGGLIGSRRRSGRVKVAGCGLRHPTFTGNVRPHASAWEGAPGLLPSRSPSGKAYTIRPSSGWRTR